MTQHIVCKRCHISAIIAFAVVTMVLPVAATDTKEDSMSPLPDTSINRVVPAGTEITVSEVGWHLHILVDGTDVIEVRYVPAPDSVTSAHNGDAIPFEYADGVLTLRTESIPAEGARKPVALRWPESRWMADMLKFEEADRATPPMTQGVLFTGSSTARMWPVAASFPTMTALNRGFGGSQFWDVFRFAGRILGAHKPEFIVLYSGDNDINGGKSPEWVFADCAAVVEQLRLLAPESRIIVLAIKGSGSRWNLYPAMQQANGFIKEYADTLDNVSFLDLGGLLLDADGQPDPTCYLQDALHLSEEGYRRWSEALEAHIRAMSE